MISSHIQYCPNCKAQLKGAFCHECGQRIHKERWNTPSLLTDFFIQITNIEKGFLYTIKALFIDPGNLIHDYWKGSTVKAYNPFRYVLLFTAINLLVSFWLGIDDILQESMNPVFIEEGVSNEKIIEADSKFDTGFNALILLLLPVFSLMTHLFFKKSKKNYGEHLILNSFMMGQQSLLGIIVQIVFYTIPALFPIFIGFNFLVGLTYNSYVFRLVFQEKLWISILKAFLIGIIGMIVFFVFIYLASSIAILLS